MSCPWWTESSSNRISTFSSTFASILPKVPAFSVDQIVFDGVTGTMVNNVDLDVRRGEIVGLTGLEGSGFEEFPYLVSGAVPAQSGTLTIGEEVLPLTAGLPRPLINHSVYLVPERRDTEGLALGESMLERTGISFKPPWPIV